MDAETKDVAARELKTCDMENRPGDSSGNNRSAVPLRVVTLGCKVNQYESEYVRQGLLENGFRNASVGEAANLCIVNTCTVTREGDAKSRQAIRRLARDNPATRIVVMGCYATRAPDEIRALPNVVEIVKDKRELPDLLGRFGVVDVPTGISEFADRHRAFVKVQDGCLLRCSYCIIPKVRPQMFSRPVDEILDEVRRLVDRGYREIVLTGIHLGHYGVDWNAGRPKRQWVRLSDLVRRIINLAGSFRVRLSSIEATEVTRELIDVIAEFPDRICPHLHICLQSGSNSILRRMKRRWCSKRFLDRCDLVAESLDCPAFTTDVIVGFPGESDDDFAATCTAVRHVGFSKIHAFPFSLRRGTPAAEMCDQIPKRIKSERVGHLAHIERELRDRYYSRLLGRRLTVLVESTIAGKEEQFTGTSCRYAPVRLSSNNMQPGRLTQVTAGCLEDGRIVAKP